MPFVVNPMPAPSTSGRETKKIAIIKEGVQVITGTGGDIARACSVLLGLTYALDQSYSTLLKYTLEVFHKLFLVPQDSKLVKALKKPTSGLTADWK